MKKREKSLFSPSPSRLPATDCHFLRHATWTYCCVPVFFSFCGFGDGVGVMSRAFRGCGKGEKEGGRRLEREREKNEEDEQAHADVLSFSLFFFFLPRHWHGAMSPSVSESRQMRQKIGCCGCCWEEEAGSAARPAAALGV